jgi:phosphohistidine phosphatase
MKTVIATRHAKSEWPSIQLPDIYRSLNERGRANAPVMANRLQQRGINIDLIICSNAARAMQTAQLIAAQLQLPSNKIEIFPELYHASPSAIDDVIAQLPNEVNIVLFVAHNFGITQWINAQCGVIANSMPTCAMAAFTIDTLTWPNHYNAKRSFLFYDYPKLVQ